MLRSITKKFSSSGNQVIHHCSHKSFAPLYICTQKACYSKVGERKHKEQMTDVRKKYKQYVEQAKQQQDEKSRKEFAEHRERVLTYREHKRTIAMQNIQKHERMMQIQKEEYERARMERAQRAINLEAIEQSKRRDNLKRLVSEAEFFITPENIDRHIDNQLNPARIVVPTMFGEGKFGVNDEVALEYLRVGKERQHLRRESIAEDPLYPNAKVFGDHMAFLETHLGQNTTELFDLYQYLNDTESDNQPSGQPRPQEVSETADEEEMEQNLDDMEVNFDMSQLELEKDDEPLEDFHIPAALSDEFVKKFEKAKPELVEGVDYSKYERLLRDMKSLLANEPISIENQLKALDDSSALEFMEAVGKAPNMDESAQQPKQRARKPEEEEEILGGPGEPVAIPKLDDKTITALENDDVDYFIEQAKKLPVDPLVASVNHIVPKVKSQQEKERLLEEMAKIPQLATAHTLHPAPKKRKRKTSNV
ncbi:hypothetical protein C9374_002309 [Naegleria lovaniensis]|uniref:Uncharacterized protein n=1 Tax=Naegleria lovaniensis TaxID=51637 RepID=A0AA88GTF7_NAELO|nr:uncharacterized protein C9374_002309 [Naegleria lovaniensis]KAG2386565.1 hypothetical protein C9374_002309 [Naegleria lovaniensis]